MARIVTKLALAAWALVIALLGGEVGLAVFRPWDHHVALSLSGTHTSSTSKLVTPSAGGTCPDVVVRRIEQTQTIPRSAWVHASDGVNVTPTPSSSPTRLSTLPPATQSSAQKQQGRPD